MNKTIRRAGALLIHTTLLCILLFSIPHLRAHAVAANAAGAGDSAPQGMEETPAEEGVISNPDEPPVYYMILNHHILLLAEGETSELGVTFFPPDVSSTSVTYTTSNPDILTVREDGLITAVHEGYAYITVTTEDETYDAKCAVAVYPAGDLASIAEEQTNWTRKLFYRSIAQLKDRECPWRSALCIGDSVTAGVQGGPGLLRWIPNYPLTISTLLNIPVFNHGVGGSSIWSGGNSAIINSVSTFENTDAVFIMGGYNDWFYGTECPIGDLETEGSFTYDFNALCNKVKDTYPKADIFVILPPTPHEHIGIEPYYDFSWIRAIEKEIAEDHGFLIVNLPADNVLNGLEEDTWKTYFSDGVHMNDHGYIALGAIVADKALKVLDESKAAAAGE